MPLDHHAVARKLQQARKLQSLSVENVSQETGINTDRIGLIEAGKSKPTGNEVLILASFYRHDFRDFLDDQRPAPFEQADILYRQYGEAFTAADRRAVQEFLYLCEIESYLESKLGVQKEEFNFTPTGTYYKRHGELAASDLRNQLGYGANEIPRDVFADFRRIGLHVFRRRLANSDISGLYIEHPTAGHCVLVNYDEDIYRQRFSVSHEAAHAIFDSSEAVVVSYRRGSSRYEERDLKEIRANRFASCYLMPPDQLLSVTNWTAESALYWAQKLRVSTAALAIGLREAGIVDESTARKIRSVKVPTVEKIDPEAPENLTDKQRAKRITMLERGMSDNYVSLAFEAHHEGIISAGRLGEALLADHVETREISVLFSRSIKHGT